MINGLTAIYNNKEAATHFRYLCKGRAKRIPLTIDELLYFKSNFFDRDHNANHIVKKNFTAAYHYIKTDYETNTIENAIVYKRCVKPGKEFILPSEVTLYLKGDVNIDFSKQYSLYDFIKNAIDADFLREADSMLKRLTAHSVTVSKVDDNTYIVKGGRIYEDDPIHIMPYYKDDII